MIFTTASVPLEPALRELCEATDVKRRDALRAIEQVAREAPGTRATAPRPAAGRNAERYPGHDGQLGYPLATLHRELTRWLLGTGRYRRYLPADARREPLAAAEQQLWSTLTRTGALEPELMRWYAVRRCSEVYEKAEPVADALGDAQRTVALEHGFADWPSLLDEAQSGFLAGLVPFEWVEDASRTLALARHNLSYPPLAPFSAGRRPPPRKDSTNSGLAASSDGVPSIRS
jgi:hypothetical protein